MDAFIARQPIFDANLEVYGYELLFRSGLEGSPLLSGFERLTGGKLGFVSIPHGSLLREQVRMLPPESTVLMIHDSVDAEADVIEACRQLKSAGYRIALDNVHRNAQQSPLLALADFVKVDVRVSGMTECRDLAGFLLPRGATLVAEHVQTGDTFELTREMGYQLFQGYFFARPVIVQGRDVPASKMSYLRLLVEIHKPGLDLPALGKIIEREVALSYKLLRYVNSAFFDCRHEVHSINQALLLLGEREIKRWASVIALSGMASDKPSELPAEALLRGRLCELIAKQAGQARRAGDLFLMGLFSLLDAMLDCPMDQILHELPLSEDVKQAMLGEPGPVHDTLALAAAYVRGQWDDLAGPAERLRVDEGTLPGLYVDALQWCDDNHDSMRSSRAA